MLWEAGAYVAGAVAAAIRVGVFLASVAWERGVSRPTTPTLPDADDRGTTTAASSRGDPHHAGHRGKVAVIGGGVAGCGAAWALAESGFEVHLFEADSVVGGNAKTVEWPDGIVTGLSVLAWPELYFNNYMKLLSVFGIEQTDVELGFYVRSADGQDYETGNAKQKLNRAHAADLVAWEHMVDAVRRVNGVFCREAEGTRPSLYNMSMLNPLNVVPLWLLARVFGVSTDFWTAIVVPMYASTFLSVNLDSVPAVIAPIVWDIMPLNRAPKLKSWSEDSRAIFDRLTQKVHVHVNAPVTAVHRDDGSTTSPSAEQLWQVNGARGFHRVVFASNALHVGKCADALPVGHRALFQGIRYTQHDDPSFVEGLIHSDPDSVFPADLRDELLASHANYIEARAPDANKPSIPQFANTFILSSWCPRSVRAGTTLPRLVTYNVDPKHRPHPDKIIGKVVNEWNHPALSTTNLASLYLLRLVQGQRGLYFCGSLATPGNGHDLSLCSGFAVARAIGAAYPFAGDSVCLNDLDKLAAIMGL
eukprot:m.228773 g.228773  ORF g.228773 m.228773 type:complete len:532 (+) comp25985_c2_seq2:210-1805(+)